MSSYVTYTLTHAFCLSTVLYRDDPVITEAGGLINHLFLLGGRGHALIDHGA